MKNQKVCVYYVFVVLGYWRRKKSLKKVMCKKETEINRSFLLKEKGMGRFLRFKPNIPRQNLTKEEKLLQAEDWLEFWFSFLSKKKNYAAGCFALVKPGTSWLWGCLDVKKFSYFSNYKLLELDDPLLLQGNADDTAAPIAEASMWGRLLYWGVACHYLSSALFLRAQAKLTLSWHWSVLTSFWATHQIYWRLSCLRLIRDITFCSTRLMCQLWGPGSCQWYGHVKGAT